MNTTKEAVAALTAPFSADHVAWRAGQKTGDGKKGQAMPHVDARHVQDRLTEVFGLAGWKTDYVEVIAEGKLLAVRCILSVFVNDQWVGKSDAAPFTSGRDHFSNEQALKGVYTEAMKRAAVHWGVARYLYNFKAPWVDLDERGRIVEPQFLPQEMLPEGEVAVAAEPKSPPPEPVPAAVKPVSEPVKPVQSPATTTVAQPQTVTASVLAPTPTVKAEVEKPLPTATESVAVSTPVSTAVVLPENGEMPQGLTENEVTLIKDLTGKLTKIPVGMVRSYVEGPKAQGKLSEAARAYLMAKIVIKEAEDAKAATATKAATPQDATAT